MKGEIFSQINGIMKVLALDSSDSTSIIEFRGEFDDLDYMCLINAGLTNLNVLPNLPNLTKLDISDNKISGDLKCISDRWPKLKHLNLNGNDINHTEDLAPLSHLSDLKYLELQACPVSSSNNYRREVFTLLPNLQFLDGLDRNDEAGSESDDENHRIDYVSILEDYDDNEEEEEEETEGEEEEEKEKEEEIEEEEETEEEEEEETEEEEDVDDVEEEEEEMEDNYPSDEDESDVYIETESDEEYHRGQKRKFEKEYDYDE